MAMPTPTKKVRICQPCMVDAKPRAVGEVLELHIDEANQLIGSLRAQAVADDAEVAAPAAEDAEQPVSGEAEQADAAAEAPAEKTEKKGK